MTTPTRDAGKAAHLNTDVWRLWVREYGARGAIQLALSHGYTGEQILQVNREARTALLSARGGEV